MINYTEPMKGQQRPVVASTSRGVKYEPRFKKEQLKSERELKPESNTDSSKEFSTEAACCFVSRSMQVYIG